MKKILSALAAGALVLTLTGCNGAAIQHEEELADLKRQAQLAEQCREEGGRYVLTVPPGYVSASYWCIWDEEREGGEW